MEQSSPGRSNDSWRQQLCCSVLDIQQHRNTIAYVRHNKARFVARGVRASKSRSVLLEGYDIQSRRVERIHGGGFVHNGHPSPRFAQHRIAKGRDKRQQNNTVYLELGPNSTSYHIQVSSASDFSAIVYDNSVVDTSVVASDTLQGPNVRYYWHVSAVNAGGEGGFSGAATFTTSALTDVAIAANGGIPTVFALNQNYPNPFNPSTKIGYDIPKVASVNVDIYDVLGRRVVSLVNGIQAPNHYLIEWNASNVSSGIYFVPIRAKSQDGSGEFNAVKKLMLMK